MNKIVFIILIGIIAVVVFNYLIPKIEINKTAYNTLIKTQQYQSTGDNLTGLTEEEKEVLDMVIEEIKREKQSSLFKEDK